MPWPRKSKVHIRTFQAGPVCLSFMVKFSNPTWEVGCHSSALSPFTSLARGWEGIYHKGNPSSLDKTLIPAAETPEGLRNWDKSVLLSLPLYS